jgi:hypothetical protein
VIDGLATVSTAIHYDAIATFGQSLLTGDLLDSQPQMSNERRILGLKMLDRHDRFFGYHKNVYRSLRCDIFKGETLLVFMNDICWYFAIDDLSKDGRHKGHSVGKLG